MLLTKKAGSLLINGRDLITSIVNRSSINQHIKKLRKAGMSEKLLTECRKVYSSFHPTEWSEITKGYLILLEGGGATPEKIKVFGDIARVFYKKHDLNHYLRIQWIAEELANCDKEGKTPQQVYDRLMVGVKD